MTDDGTAKPGPTDRWAKASVEEKLEILRQDIIDIATAQNRTAREFRDLGYRIDFIRGIFNPIRCLRSETVLNSRGVDVCPPAPGSERV